MQNEEITLIEQINFSPKGSKRYKLLKLIDRKISIYLSGSGSKYKILNRIKAKSNLIKSVVTIH